MVLRLSVCLLSIGVMIVDAELVFGLDYPTRPIRLVTAPAGGANDILARTLSPGLTDSLGQQVIVDNRPAGVIPGQIVSNAAPDGHTLLVTSGLLWILPFIQKVPFDPVRDFSPITAATSAASLLVVHPSVAANSVKELIALAKARPGELNYASGATASNSHLTAELFKSMAGINITRIPYKGEGPAVIGLLGGEAQIMFASVGTASAHAKAGKLRVLGVSRAQPSALVPDVPTVAASGVAGFESLLLLCIFAPAKTPAAIIERLNREIVRILNTLDVKERLLRIGAEVVANSPKEFAAMIKSDMAKWEKVTKEAGIRAE